MVNNILPNQDTECSVLGLVDIIIATLVMYKKLDVECTSISILVLFLGPHQAWETLGMRGSINPTVSPSINRSVDLRPPLNFLLLAVQCCK